MCTDHNKLYSGCGHKQLTRHETCDDYLHERVKICEVIDNDTAVSGVCDACSGRRSNRTRPSTSTNDLPPKDSSRYASERRESSRHNDSNHGGRSHDSNRHESNRHDSSRYASERRESNHHNGSSHGGRTHDSRHDNERHDGRHHDSNCPPSAFRSVKRNQTSHESQPRTEQGIRYDLDGGRTAFRRETTTHRDPSGRDHGYTTHTEFVYQSGDTREYSNHYSTSSRDTGGRRRDYVSRHDHDDAESVRDRRYSTRPSSRRPSLSRANGERWTRYRQPGYESDSPSDSDTDKRHENYGRSHRSHRRDRE